jgi:hypothetical protein
MHVTKNVFDNIIRTLLDMPRKSKDRLKSCTDLVQFELRPELHPISRPNGKYFLPPASYTLIVLIIAIWAIKLVHVKVIITRLCYFFNTISQKVIGRKELNDLRAYMIETICMLEMCVPPSFFDMQQHLMIHLVDQIHTLGPLYLYSMFLYERYLTVLKSYMQNRAHSKGSIIKGYTTEEVVECCVDYVKDGKRIGIPIPLHNGKLRGRGRMCYKSFVDRDYNSVSGAHFSVLQ